MLSGASSLLHLGRAGRILFLGVVEQLYRMRDRGIPAALRKLNRMRDCVVLMKKVVTVLLPLASVLLLVYSSYKGLVKLQ